MQYRIYAAYFLVAHTVACIVAILSPGIPVEVRLIALLISTLICGTGVLLAMLKATAGAGGGARTPNPAAQPRTSQKMAHVFKTMQQWWCGTFLRHRGTKTRVFDRVELKAWNRVHGALFGAMEFAVTDYHYDCGRCGKSLPKEQWGVGPFRKKGYPNPYERLRRTIGNWWARRSRCYCTDLYYLDHRTKDKHVRNELMQS